jgi:hypothetical protein
MNGNLLLQEKITKFTKHGIFSPRALSPPKKYACYENLTEVQDCEGLKKIILHEIL